MLSGKSIGIMQRRRDNELKQCIHTNCFNGRHELSGFCKKHWKRNTEWGHPDGTCIKRSLFQIEYGQVSEIVDRNFKTHKGMIHGLNEIKSFLSKVSVNPSFPEQIARLEASPKVTPEAILKEAAAVHLFRENKPYYFKSDRHFTYVVGHRIVNIVPLEVAYSKVSGRKYGKAISPKARRIMGEFICSRLGILLYNISHHVKEIEERQHEIARAMGAPLS